MLDKIRQRLAVRLSVGILLMTIPIFILSLGIMYLQSRYFIRQEATDRANSVLQNTMQCVRTFMNTIETATNANGWLVEEDFQPEKLLDVSRRTVWMNGHVSGCSITAEPDAFPRYGRYFSAYSVRMGDSIATVRESEYEYYDKPWYKMAHDLGKACWVEPFDDYNETSLYNPEIIASYCKPLRNGEGRIIGVMATDLSLRSLAETIDSISHSYPNAYFVLIGHDGKYFVHPDTARAFKKTIFTDANPQNHSDLIVLGHEMTAGKQGSMRVDVDGEPSVVCYCPVPGTDWSLALVCPEGDILGRYHQLGYIITLLIVVGMLIITILSWRTVARAMHPINELLGLSRMMINGQYDKLIPRTRREDVVGQLQNSFASMQESLNFHMGSIRYAAEVSQRRNEELAQATRLAEEAVRQKISFIQNVTHQIRTPLNIIMGFAQVLRDSQALCSATSQQLLSAEEVTSIKGMMKHNTSILNRLVDMLFDSSDSGAFEELNTQKQDLVSCNGLGRECIEYAQSNFPGIQVAFESDVADDFSIHTSRLYLMRSLRELLYNAAKYSDRQHLSLRITHTDSQVQFCVEDTGPGISGKDREQMFHPFSKVDDLTEGLGLGLPLSKRHALSLGGDLTLDTSYESGCRFRLVVPVQ